MEKGRDTLNLYFMCLHIFGLVPIKVLVKVVCIISLVLYTFLTVKHLKKPKYTKTRVFLEVLLVTIVVGLCTVLLPLICTASMSCCKKLTRI